MFLENVLWQILETSTGQQHTFEGKMSKTTALNKILLLNHQMVPVFGLQYEISSNTF